MTNWYLSIGDHVKGPFTTDLGKKFVRENHGAYCWQQNFNDWKPAHEVSEIWPLKKDGVTPFPKPLAHMMSTKPVHLPVAEIQAKNRENLQQTIKQKSPLPDNQSFPVRQEEQNQNQDQDGNIQFKNQSNGFGSDEFTEGIDFHIYGHEMQYIEVELDSGESAVAEAGALMYKTENIDMKTIFGDGSTEQQGFMSRLWGAGQRLLTGESLFITVFTQNQPGKGRVAFGAPFPGTIIPLNLTDYQNTIICQKDSFLAGAKGLQIGIYFQKKILTGLFGGEGFIMQKIQGDGWVFMHVGGAVKEINLAPGEVLHVDTGCLAAMTADIDFDIMQAGGIKTMLFGGEGLCFAKLTGPGKVWLQSLPFSRLAGRMLACAPGSGSKRQGEGSILGTLGDLAGGRS